MPIPATEASVNGGVGGAAKQVAEHASSIAKLELELATYELKKKLAFFGIGIAFAVGAAVLALYMLGFALAAVAAALATFLDTWLALLIVSSKRGEVGPISVTAKSEGLAGATAQIASRR